jgi:hypothetical protein
MSRMVIAAYRPRPGRQQALEHLMRHHHERLRTAGLVTDRPATLMRASDGTVVEVFEWLSADAIAAAPKDASVQAMWREYEAVCDSVPLTEVAEARSLFAEFEPLSSEAELLPELSP